MKKALIRLSLASLLLIIIGGITSYIAYQQFSTWFSSENSELTSNQRFTVVKGASLRRVAAELHNKGWLAHPRVFEYLARANGATDIKAGNYVLYANESPEAMLARFVSGEVELHRIALVEGKTLKQWLSALNGASKLAAVAPATAATVVDALSLERSNPEGLFLPDTYTYAEGDSALSILRLAYARMQEELDVLWQDRAKDLPINSPYEALILASIVEKETSIAAERNKIAGVFIRRLNKGMKLQTDPTIIYGMGDSYKGNIRRKDLRAKNPYNTYFIDGLPPTPIAMPSKESIEAALNPDMSGSALFFVAKGDGTHKFSTTYEEHKKAVKDFQLKRRSDYRSTPSK